jgi:hypothetical protein
MNKIIFSITPTSINHPAVDKLYSVIFSDESKILMYEETFYHHFEDYSSHHDLNSLIGRELDPSQPVFDEVI